MQTQSGKLVTQSQICGKCEVCCPCYECEGGEDEDEDDDDDDDDDEEDDDDVRRGR